MGRHIGCTNAVLVVINNVILHFTVIYGIEVNGIRVTTTKRALWVLQIQLVKNRVSKGTYLTSGWNLGFPCCDRTHTVVDPDVWRAAISGMATLTVIHLKAALFPFILVIERRVGASRAPIHGRLIHPQYRTPNRRFWQRARAGTTTA
jgi:hypothetical protein